MRPLVVAAICLWARADGLVVAPRAAGLGLPRRASTPALSASDGLTPEERMRERVRRAEAAREAEAEKYRARAAREAEAKAEADARVRRAAERYDYGLSTSDRQKASLEAMLAGAPCRVRATCQMSAVRGVTRGVACAAGDVRATAADAAVEAAARGGAADEVPATYILIN